MRKEIGRGIERGRVEETGERWAGRRMEAILAREPSRVIKVIRAETAEKIRQFPKLARVDPRVYTLHFSPFGEIFVPRWREIEREEVMADPEDFIQVRRPRERHRDLANLPEREIVELIYMEVDNLEAAIRQQQHIVGAYETGREAQQIMRVMSQMNFQLETTLAGKLTKKSLRAMAVQTERFLITSGLADAKLATKRKIAKLLLGATELDSLGRINPLIMRIRLRAAYLRAIERAILPVLVSEKFGSFLGLFLMEREITRQAAQGAIECLDTMVGITKRGAIVFEDPREGLRSSPAERQGIGKVLKEVAGSLARGRLLPYLPEFRWAAINLAGCREKYQETN